MTVLKKVGLMQTGPWSIVRNMSSWLDRRDVACYTQDSHEWSSKQNVLRNLKSASSR